MWLSRSKTTTNVSGLLADWGGGRTAETIIGKVNSELSGQLWISDGEEGEIEKIVWMGFCLSGLMMFNL